MANGNGKASILDIVHRVGIWGFAISIGIYMLNIGQWVGAADEKFKDAQTVEEKQDALILQVNTVAILQGVQTTAIQDNKDAIETSRREILEAIKEVNEAND